MLIVHFSHSSCPCMKTYCTSGEGCLLLQTVKLCLSSGLSYGSKAFHPSSTAKQKLKYWTVGIPENKAILVTCGLCSIYNTPTKAHPIYCLLFASSYTYMHAYNKMLDIVGQAEQVHTNWQEFISCHRQPMCLRQ